MALLVAEGFDDISSSSFSHTLLNKRYWSGALVTDYNNAGNRISGRYHGYAKNTSSSSATMGVWTFPANLSEIFLAFAFYRNTATLFTWAALRDGSSTQVDFRSAGDGSTLEITRNGTTLGTVANAFPLSTWVWLSIRVVIHSSAGIVEVRDGNGTVLANLTGLNTQATANAYATNLRLVNAGLWDDLFVMDTSGASFNGHLTERSIRTLFPSADGASSAWTPNGAANRWECVDEDDPDGDTTYLASQTTAHVNLSQLGNMGAGEQGIDAVIWQHRSRRDNLGSRSVRGVIRAGGANYNGATIALDTGYKQTADVWETNPATGLAWTPADVDGIEGGVELVG